MSLRVGPLCVSGGVCNASGVFVVVFHDCGCVLDGTIWTRAAVQVVTFWEIHLRERQEDDEEDGNLLFVQVCAA